MPYKFKEKSMQKSPTKFLLGLLAAVFFLPAASTLAQDPPPPVSEIWVMVPKAGHEQEMSAAIAKHSQHRSEQGDPRQWVAYTPLLGDELNHVAVRSCCHNWADVDGYREWLEAHPAVNAHFGEHVAPHVERYAHYFEEIDWANSHWNSDGGPYTLFAVTQFALKSGHEADFHAAREKMSQIAINQGWANDERSWLWTTTIGGKSTVSVVVPYKNFAGMGSSGEGFVDFLAQQLGSMEAASELMKQFAGASWGSDYQVWVYEPKLSMKNED